MHFLSERARSGTVFVLRKAADQRTSCRSGWWTFAFNHLATAACVAGGIRTHEEEIKSLYAHTVRIRLLRCFYIKISAREL